MDTKSNIVLIGMPGAGKSTLGVVLAKILGKDFIDCDILIQHEYGKTLQKLIDENGAEGFIEIEGSVLSSIDVQNTIISTGGSAIYSDDAMKHLAELGPIVYLEVSLEELTARLGGLHERGVVMKNGMGMSLSDLYEERVPLYEKYAQVTIEIKDLTVRSAAQLCVDKLSLL